jgi:thymidylate synthase
MPTAPINTVIRAPNAAEGFARALQNVRDLGAQVPAETSKSVGANRSTQELINFTVAIENPTDRLIRNPKYVTPIVPAIARFVWMMAGNNRLADIAYYEPKVRAFSDDGLSVPGSDYGMRMLQPRPGLNQIAGVIAELRQHRSSRRAMVAVYHPEDATRQESSDIPCTFGFDYLIRDGELLATTIMRSNNAIGLLPFNFFEFSMLAELIAGEVGVKLGPMSHIALSMHIYEKESARADEIIAAAPKAVAAPMDPMPSQPLMHINYLAQLEAELRHSGTSINDATIENWIKRADDPKLGPYWGQFFLVLLLHTASRVNLDAAAAVRAAVGAPFLQLLPAPPNAVAATTRNDVDLFTREGSVRSAPAFNVLKTARMRSLKAHMERHVAESGQPLPISIVWNLQEHFAQRAAARGDAPEISGDEFAAALTRAATKAT